MKDDIRDKEAYKSAKERVEAKFGFKIHLLIYVLVSTLLVIVNLNGSTEYFWAKWPMLGWGIAVVVHWFRVFVFSGRSPISDEMIKKEMQRTASKEL